MQNKKSLIIILIPIILILILVIIKSLNKNNFSLDSKQTLEISLNQNHILSFKQLKDKLQNHSVTTLIDLRKVNEFNQGHFKNALNMPFSDILNNPEMEKLKLAKNEMVLYSNSISESVKAWTILSQMGYQKLYLLDIPGDLISESLFEKDIVLESNEVLKYKFHPDSLVGME
jgi:rhodanese-related sulfurtransferase